MSLLTATDLSQSFGADDIFTDISLEIHGRDRIGLVGPNGVGKTTLLLILAGLQQPRSGDIRRASTLTLGYLRQEAVLTFADANHTIYEEMLSVFAALREMEQALRDLEARMSAGEMGEAVLDEYGRIQETYELGGGYNYHNDIKHVLMGLGFTEDDWQTPLAHLSGGQKTRVLLGRLLLEKPELLILDEPTNHLDMAAVEWLEATLRRWEGALLIVSHDRYFLDRVVNQVWEMTPTAWRTYRGNYSSYVQQRQLAWEHAQAVFAAEKARLEKDLAFARKHIAGGKTDIAKGKLRRLTRDLMIIEEQGALALQNSDWIQIGSRVRTLSVNEAAKRIQALAPPDDRPPKLNIRLQSGERSGRHVIKSKKLKVGYDDEVLFTADEIKLERQEVAALIGPNGSGKTTFLRLVLDEIRPLGGWLKLGPGTKIAYFAQAHDQLVLENRVIDELTRQHSGMNEQEARNYLAQYLFRGDDVFKPVGALSGGERGRLALALLALTDANFLLLDEPTNHLDIPSQEVLQEVMEAFQGTILMVSHDRYLVDRLATQIWELRDGHLHVFKGTYQELLHGRGAADEQDQAKVVFVEEPEEAPVPELDWVANLAPPPGPMTDREKRERRKRRQELVTAVDNSEAWLAQLRYEQADAQERGDTAEVEALAMEIAEAEAELTELNAALDELANDVV